MQMLRRMIAAMLALAAANASAAAAQPPGSTVVTDPTPPAGPSEAVQALQTLDLARLESDAAYAEQMSQRLAALRARVADQPEVVSSLDQLRMYALITAGHRREAGALLDRLAAQPIDQAQDFALLWFGALRLQAYPRAVALVEQASRSIRAPGWPALRALLEREHVWMVMRHFNGDAGKPTQYRFAEALLRFGWPGHDDRGTTDSLRMILIEQQLGQSDGDSARALARTIETPREMVSLILMRRFDPAVGEGDRLAMLNAAIASHDAETARAVADRPTDLRRVLARAEFLRGVGREEDALALLEPFTRDVPATVALADEGMWLINHAGYALLALERNDEAIALMERLVALPVAERGALIGPYINHSIMLWRAGRLSESLAYATQLDRDHADAANDYGRMWILSSIVCGMEGLGQRDAIAPTLRRMRRLADANPAALIRAHLCLGDLEAAEAVVIQMLEGDRADTVMLWFQDYEGRGERGLNRDFQSRVTALHERPRVRAALERKGRILTLPLSRIYWGTI
jgi:tetratricopeptide (TPR) repeat protein